MISVAGMTALGFVVSLGIAKAADMAAAAWFTGSLHRL